MTHTEAVIDHQHAALVAIRKYARKWASVPKRDEHMYQWKRICKAIELAAQDGLLDRPLRSPLNED